jgi:hypothetical protein
VPERHCPGNVFRFKRKCLAELVHKAQIAIKIIAKSIPRACLGEPFLLMGL